VILDTSCQNNKDLTKLGLFRGFRKKEYGFGPFGGILDISSQKNKDLSPVGHFGRFWLKE
jgi:hypothetical protein